MNEQTNTQTQTCRPATGFAILILVVIATLIMVHLLSRPIMNAEPQEQAHIVRQTDDEPENVALIMEALFGTGAAGE